MAYTILVLILKNESTKCIKNNSFFINTGWLIILWEEVLGDWRGTEVLYSELGAKYDKTTVNKVDLLWFSELLVFI